MPEVPMVPDENLATQGLDKVPTMWTDSHDNTIDVPLLSDSVLDSHMRSNSNLREHPGMLVVVGLNLLCFGSCMFLSLFCGSLPLWGKCSINGELGVRLGLAV